MSASSKRKRYLPAFIFPFLWKTLIRSIIPRIGGHQSHLPAALFCSELQEPPSEGGRSSSPPFSLIYVCVLKVSAAAAANVPGRPPSSELHLRVLHVPFIRESFQPSAYYSQQVQSIPGEPRRRNKFPWKGHIYIRDAWTCQLGLQQVIWRETVGRKCQVCSDSP